MLQKDEDETENMTTYVVNIKYDLPVIVLIRNDRGRTITSQKESMNKLIEKNPDNAQQVFEMCIKEHRTRWLPYELAPTFDFHKAFLNMKFNMVNIIDEIVNIRFYDFYDNRYDNRGTINIEQTLEVEYLSNYEFKDTDIQELIYDGFKLTYSHRRIEIEICELEFNDANPNYTYWLRAPNGPQNITYTYHEPTCCDYVLK